MTYSCVVDPVISIKGLTRRFGETTAVDDLSLQVESGEIFGLLGHNGAGKTTTVRLLNGLLEPDSGEVQVLGMNPARNGSALRRRTGVSTETPSVDDRMTGRAALSFFADLYDVPALSVASRVSGLLEEYGLGDAADRKIGTYSKGMKQRLALARTLLHEPELLFLDEPTSGLDPVAARGVNDAIVQMSRQGGRTVLLCTHNLVQAQELCDRVAVLERGRLVAIGSPRELAAQLRQPQELAIEVAAGDAERAAGLLAARNSSTPVVKRDDLVVANIVGREQIPELIALLTNAGVRIYGVNAEHASLEDVYFALHEERPEVSR